MILKTLQSVNSVIMDSVNHTIDKQAAKNFKNQILALNVSITQLEQLLNLIQAFSERNFATGVVSKEIRDSLQTAVDSCGQKTYDHSLDVNTVTALKNAIELCRNSLANAWREEADEKCSSVIESLASLKGLLGNKREVNRLTDNLNIASNPEIKPFIDKVRRQRATVGDLTPPILEWLNKNHLTDKIMLRFQTYGNSG